MPAAAAGGGSAQAGRRFAAPHAQVGVEFYFDGQISYQLKCSASNQSRSRRPEAFSAMQLGLAGCAVFVFFVFFWHGRLSCCSPLAATRCRREWGGYKVTW